MTISNDDYYFGHEYSRFIRFNMLQSTELKNREISMFFKKRFIRGMYAYDTGTLEYLLKKWDQRNTALFHSVAIGDGRKFEHRKILDFIKNAKESRDRYFEIFNSTICGYDYIIDIDAPNLLLAYRDAKKVYDYFISANIPFGINFSGGKGFHIRIPWAKIENTLTEYIQTRKSNASKDTNTNLESDDIKKLPDLFKQVTEKLISSLKLKYVDTTIYQLLRVIRVPYSVHQNNRYVCLPLTNEQFENFDTLMCRKEDVLSIFPLKNRGMMYRNGEVTSLFEQI